MICQEAPTFSQDFGLTWFCHGHWLTTNAGQEMANRLWSQAHADSST